MFSLRRCSSALLVTLMACSGVQDDNSASTSATVLTIATPADADALVPQLVQSTQGMQAADLLFDHLARPTSSLETVGDAGFKPELAQSWQ